MYPETQRGLLSNDTRRTGCRVSWAHRPCGHCYSVRGGSFRRPLAKPMKHNTKVKIRWTSLLAWRLAFEVICNVCGKLENPVWKGTVFYARDMARLAARDHINENKS